MLYYPKILTPLLFVATLWLPISAQVPDLVPMSHAGKPYTVPNDVSDHAAAFLASLQTAQSASQPTIIVRYLGYTCAHCVRQLDYLNYYSKKLRNQGVRIVAISGDPIARWQQLVESHNLDTSLYRYVSDSDGAIARGLAAQRIENDTTFDLHATIVNVGSKVVYATFGDEPDMDVARIVGSIPNMKEEFPAAVEPEFIDRYLTQQPTTTIIAGPNDGVKEPLDLDFNRSFLHADDLWVVTTDKRGHAVSIIHNATSPKPVIVNRKDSRASHFMWRTTALAMGDNGAFATAQNGEPGDGDSEYMFMGPTLWSSDTAVFASRYQDDDKFLASHLDMLHQSPYNLGIAHDTANVYWVSDAKYPGISRYDFRDPHEVGGTDHRDGVIRRYVETQLKVGERGRPAHVALDKSTGYLYYVDPGNGAIHCLDTRTGNVGDTLVMPPSSTENLEEFTAVTGAEFWTVISSLNKPIGIEVCGRRLLVGDAQTSRIHVYGIDGKTVTPMGYIQTSAQSLHGIVVGPDQRIWYVDKTAGTVCRLDLGLQNALSAARRVAVRRQRDTLTFLYTNNGNASYQPAYKTRIWTAATNIWSQWTQQTGPTISAGSTEPLICDIQLPDSTTWYIVEIAEADGKGIGGLTSRCVVIPQNARKMIVNHERYGTFDIAEAVRQTTRKGYAAITSDLFIEIADELPVIKTILWNSGTSGEISAVDDAVLRACSARNIDIMIIGDDPLLLRTDMAQSVQFFREFGASLRGADLPDNDNGLRRYTGVLADPVTSGISTIECQLPRLNHHRGAKYVPSVLFNPAGGVSMMRSLNDTAHVGIRYQKGTFRSIILGINASRFLDGGQRTLLLDKGLAWLEGAADPDPIDTTSTSVSEEAADDASAIRISAYTHGRLMHWNANHAGVGNMTIELYASTGQKVADIYTGSESYPTGTIDLQHVSAGCYHIIARSEDRVTHRSIIIR